MRSNERFSYPPAEHYRQPRTPHEQVDYEMLTYQTPPQLRAEVAALRLGYEKTPFMQCMAKYAQYAAVVRSPEASAGSESFNTDFYSGTLMAVHINVAPAPESVQRHVLRTRFIPTAANDANDDLYEIAAKETLLEWAGEGDANWESFYNLQTKAYRKRAMAICGRLYEDREDSFERQLDFIMGYTFASNLVWITGRTHTSRAPV